ncbi:helix-turn-helix domain-containing protein [Pleionea sediminis]|uniref:helix-turn-helix domain-containing protein n=1 Tax=Pleionea sediminis TaxID=2569479 RepID=UPI00118494FE|nr:helix-turn-helix transcriptional regulator [Pleionea sediminis]
MFKFKWAKTVSSINQKTVERCLKEIKVALKNKGIKYSDIAERLNLSNVTVKRILNQSDIGLDRLITLADIAGLDVVQLIKNARVSPQKHYLFNDVQDKAFFDNEHLLHYFSELFYFKKTPEQIQRENNLTDISTYRYLRKLEDIELIKLLPENKLHFLCKAPLGFSANSLVLKQKITNHIKSTCDAVLSKNENEYYFMRVKPLRVPEGFYLQMIEELKKVVDRYAEIAEVAYISQSNLPEFQVTIVGHPYNAEGSEFEPIVNVDSFK